MRMNEEQKEAVKELVDVVNEVISSSQSRDSGFVEAYMVFKTSDGNYMRMVTAGGMGMYNQYLGSQHDFGGDSHCKKCGAYGPHEEHMPCHPTPGDEEESG